MASCVLAGLAFLGGCRDGRNAAPAVETSTTESPASTTVAVDPLLPRTATGANGNPRDERLGPPADSGPSDGTLSEGLCFDEFLVATADQTSHARNAKPCEQPHDAETFAVLALAGDATAPFPGEATAQRLARSACLRSFDAYVGREYAVSTLRIAVLRPSGTTWLAGDRAVVCSLYHQDLVPLLGPAQGSRR